MRGHGGGGGDGDGAFVFLGLCCLRSVSGRVWRIGLSLCLYGGGGGLEEGSGSGI